MDERSSLLAERSALIEDIRRQAEQQDWPLTVSEHARRAALDPTEPLTRRDLAIVAPDAGWMARASLLHSSSRAVTASTVLMGRLCVLTLSVFVAWTILGVFLDLPPSKWALVGLTLPGLCYSVSFSFQRAASRALVEGYHLVPEETGDGYSLIWVQRGSGAASAAGYQPHFDPRKYQSEYSILEEGTLYWGPGKCVIERGVRPGEGRRPALDAYRRAFESAGLFARRRDAMDRYISPPPRRAPLSSSARS